MKLPRGAKLLLIGSGLLLGSMVASVLLPEMPWEGEQTDVVVEGDTLPVDEDELFEWVQTEMGADVKPPTIVVTDDPQRTYTRQFPGRSGAFHRLLLTENETSAVTKSPPAYYLARTHTIYLDPSLVPDEGDDAGRRDLAVILVEEYVHAIQFQNGAFDWNRPDRDDPADRHLAWRAVKEGGDVYVASEYADQHFPSRRNLSVGVRETYRNATATDRYFIAPYYFGDRYLRVRTDAPSDVLDAYSEPPETTEQLLHPASRPEERPTYLEMRVSINGRTTELFADRQGELFIRLVLSQCLSRDDAARAAAGWGTDRLYSIWSEGTRNYAWALQWDDRTEATEFEDAFRRYLDCRAHSDDGEVWRGREASFEVQRLTNRTVVAFVGEPSFLTNVTATERNGTVSVRLRDRGNVETTTDLSENGSESTTEGDVGTENGTVTESRTVTTVGESAATSDAPRDGDDRNYTSK